MGRENREERFQEAVIRFLGEHDIYPFSVTYTYEVGPDGVGLLSITMYVKADYDNLLDLLDYKSQCDKSGYIVFPDTNTIILQGIALANLYTTRL